MPFGNKCQGFLGGTSGKESACSAGDPGLIPESGRSPGGGHGNPLQYSCLGIPWTEKPSGLVYRVAKSWTPLKRLSTCHAQRR